MNFMQWFYDLKTIYKMAILISFMAVGMVGVGYTGYYFAEKNAQSLESMYKDRLEPVYQLTG